MDKNYEMMINNEIVKLVKEKQMTMDDFDAFLCVFRNYMHEHTLEEGVEDIFVTYIRALRKISNDLSMLEKIKSEAEK